MRLWRRFHHKNLGGQVCHKIYDGFVDLNKIVGPLERCSSMRIIKLSTEEFETIKDVVTYFEEHLPSTNPPERFRITERRITEDGLEIGEPLLFSYQTTVLFTAEAASGRLDNNDEKSDTYPFLFLVNMATLRPSEISLYDIEEQLHQTGERKSLVQSQGRPIIPDSPFSENLWQTLRENQ